MKNKVLSVRPKAIVKYLNGDETDVTSTIALSRDLTLSNIQIPLEEVIEGINSLMKEEISTLPRDIIKDLIQTYKENLIELKELQQLTRKYNQYLESKTQDELGLTSLPYFKKILHFNFKEQPSPLDLIELKNIQHFLHALDTGALFALQNHQ